MPPWFIAQDNIYRGTYLIDIQSLFYNVFKVILGCHSVFFWSVGLYYIILYYTCSQEVFAANGELLLRGRLLSGIFCDLLTVTKLGFVEPGDNHRCVFLLIPNGFSDGKLNLLCGQTASALSSCQEVRWKSILHHPSWRRAPVHSVLHAGWYQGPLPGREASRFL